MRGSLLLALPTLSNTVLARMTESQLPVAHNESASLLFVIFMAGIT